MIALDDFQRLSLEDKPAFDAHFSRFPPQHSDNVFTTMISWMEYGNYHYVFVDGTLILMSNINNQLQFRPPSGKYNADIMNQVLQLAQKEGGGSPVGLIDTKSKNQISQDFQQLAFIEDRDYFDYVYRSSDLADLPGSDYRKIRNRLNKFQKNYEYSAELISETNIDEIGEFLKRWCLWKDCASDPLLEHEKKAILYSMKHFFDLNLSGIALRVLGAIEAIAVFEGICSDTTVVHYEKGSPDYDGIYKLINAETAKLLQKNYPFINRESDMGYPGLRQAKMSYRPHHMVEVYHVNKENLII